MFLLVCMQLQIPLYFTFNFCKNIFPRKEELTRANFSLKQKKGYFFWWGWGILIVLVRKSLLGVFFTIEKIGFSQNLHFSVGTRFSVHFSSEEQFDDIHFFSEEAMLTAKFWYAPSGAVTGIYLNKIKGSCYLIFFFIQKGSL